jgi:hypothetical protein
VAPAAPRLSRAEAVALAARCAPDCAFLLDFDGTLVLPGVNS